MSIMEKNLPNANSVKNGDYIRIITSDGESQKVDKTEAIGYDVQTSTVKETLLEETSVTAVSFGHAALSGIDCFWTTAPDTVVVTFDGTEYTLNVIDADGIYIYGTDTDIQPVDWSECPFSLTFSDSDKYHINIQVETAGTYTIKIETFASEIITTNNFEKAVKSISNVLIIEEKDDNSECLNATPKDVLEALSIGKTILYCDHNRYYQFLYIVPDYTGYNTVYIIAFIQEDKSDNDNFSIIKFSAELTNFFSIASATK